MSGYLKFEPTSKKSDYYFISYNTEDANRVGKICRSMLRSHPEIDFWYDVDIHHDEQWSAKIANKIKNCKEVIFFVTRGIFEKAKKRFASGEYKKITDVWTFQEYSIARSYEKRILVVYLDDIHIDMVCDELVGWFEELNPSNGLQGIIGFDKRYREIGESIYAELIWSSDSKNNPGTNYPSEKTKHKAKKSISFKRKLKSIFIIIFVSVILALSVFGIIRIFDLNTNKGSNSEKSAGVVSVFGNSEERIFFGKYPQSRVTDSEMLEKLNSKKINWIPFKYYEGKNLIDGSMKTCEIAYYSDVKYKGEKYRAVFLKKYRATLTSEESISSANKNKIKQAENGYKLNEVYWFKYEPISWIVLDKNKGIAVSEVIIDAQPYVNELYKGKDDEYYNRSGDFSNCWESSYLRDWLNSDFLDVAFSDSEKKAIDNSIDNNLTDISSEIHDKVFILDFDDLTNTEYGFMENADTCDELRTAYGTDYAKSQNLYVFNENGEHSDSIGKSYYSVRTEGKSSRNISFVDTIGCLLDYDYVNDTSCGVRPAIKVDLSSKYINK